MGATQVAVSYYITSAPPQRADAAQLAQLMRVIREHWGIENQVHWARDPAWDEDRCQVRKGAAPQAMAACRNLAQSLLRRQGCRNIAAALRTNAGWPKTAVGLALAIPEPTW